MIRVYSLSYKDCCMSSWYQNKDNTCEVCSKCGCYWVRVAEARRRYKVACCTRRRVAELWCLSPGYVQGMSDLLSPLLYVMESEVEGFWCFVSFMDQMVKTALYLT